MSSKTKEYEKYTWDGVIKHRSGPSSSGWKRWHCRCPECWVFGQEINRRNREREQAIRDGKVKVENFKHGLDGYRIHKCRCPECAAAGRRFNENNREAGRNRRAYKERPEGETSIVIETPGPDWDELAHLRPGHNVRRRKAA